MMTEQVQTLSGVYTVYCYKLIMLYTSLWGPDWYGTVDWYGTIVVG